MAAVVTVNDVIHGRVGLDAECLDRIYLNGYVPTLQFVAQVASFMTAHLSYPIPSPAIMEKMGTERSLKTQDNPQCSSDLGSLGKHVWRHCGEDATICIAWT